MDLVRLHILVVDDVADAADSTAELLNIWGYDARACYSGTDALVSARERCPDVVLLDLGMPLMDGFRFTTLFRSLPGCEEVPVVALSGYSSPAYLTRARAVGIRHFLVKPADPDRLKELLTWEFEPAASRVPSDSNDVEDQLRETETADEIVVMQ